MLKSLFSATDTFDLSLLSMDSEIDTHLSEQQQQQISRSQSPDYIPTTVFETIDKSWGNNQQQSTEHISQDLSKSTAQQLNRSPQEKFLTIFPPSPTPSVEFTTTFAGINIKKEQWRIRPNGDNSSNNFIGLYPPSPPDSNGAPSPIGYQYSDVKNEPFDINCTESSIDIDSFFQQNSFELAAKTILTPSTSPSSSASPLSVYGGIDIYNSIDQTIFGGAAISDAESSTNVATTTLDTPRKDHQLLREYLQDNTFQKKHNLKPLALESLFVDDGWDVRGDIEPVISLALEHARKDVQQTCVTLNISSGKSWQIFYFVFNFSFLFNFQWNVSTFMCKYVAWL